MAMAASSEELRSGFEENLEQTKEHVERLKQVRTSLGEKATAKKCPGMIGIVEEGEEMMDQDFGGAIMDAALISVAQRVNNYEIAAYGCVHAWAQVLGKDSAANLLEKALGEETATDEKLTELAEEISAQANSGSEEDESAGSTESSYEEENIHVSKPRSRNAGANIHQGQMGATSKVVTPDFFSAACRYGSSWSISDQAAVLM